MSNYETPICEWFATCDHPAVGTVKHPVLGDVPVCERCSDKLGLEVTPLPFCDECRADGGFIEAGYNSGWCGDCFGGYPDSDEMHDVINGEHDAMNAILDGIDARQAPVLTEAQQRLAAANTKRFNAKFGITS